MEIEVLKESVYKMKQTPKPWVASEEEALEEAIDAFKVSIDGARSIMAAVQTAAQGSLPNHQQWKISTRASLLEQWKISRVLWG